MDQNLSFHRSLHTAHKPRALDKAWDAVQDAYKQEDFRGVVTGIINFVEDGLAARTGNADQTRFTIPHGSIVLDIDISGKCLEVTAPFLNIADSKRIPLMRKVTELNFSPLNLSQIRLKDDDLEFRYRCPIELSEPYKTYDALREICFYADSSDDEFIQKFGAKWIVAPRVEPFTEAEKDSAWNNMQLYLKEASEGVSYFENKRVFNLAWDILVIAIMKLEYYIRPQGNLRNEIEKMVAYLTTAEGTINDKVNKGKGYLNKLSQMSRDDFNKDLYRTQTFIPYKSRSSHSAIRNSSENAFTQAKTEMDQGNHLGATLTMSFHFANLFYHNNLPEDITEILEKALEKASGKPWPEASAALFIGLTSVMAAGDEPSGSKRRGFFSKLFGKKDQ